MRGRRDRDEIARRIDAGAAAVCEDPRKTLREACANRVTRIKEGLAGTNFVDVTDAIDRLKAIKSGEEIGLIRRCAEMQDAVFAKIARAIKPGMRDIDVTALAQHEGQVLGSEQGIFLGNSAPVGQSSLS